MKEAIAPNQVASKPAFELLAPAGDISCLHAAIRAGAQAVYLGLDKFNARRNASNFTLENLPDACRYAHLRGVRVYVTMNIEILPNELHEALTYATKAYEAGADALILQDIGLVNEISKSIPGARMHFSTQMNIHNAAGIELAAALGAQRVTLARELSLAEIADLTTLAHEYNLEVECFAHGALCICYSGQCLMSSLIGGRSANRGLCAQACRLPYELHTTEDDILLPAEGEHLLSPKDLCTINLLPDLEQAGVHSLKIEGRMKSADYVYEVVSVYREAIDNANIPSEDADLRLAEAFSRGFTTAYLESKRDNDIMSYTRPNNRGIAIGRVSELQNNTARIKTDKELHAGDLLEIWTNRGRFTHEVESDTKAGNYAVLPVDTTVNKGDRVFRIRNAQTAFDDDPFEPRIPIKGSITLQLNEPARILFKSGNVSAYAEGTLVEAARTKELTVQEVTDHINRLGQTPFVLETPLDIQIDEGVGMSFSALHHLRTDALEQLEQALLDAYEAEREKETFAQPLDLTNFLPPAPEQDYFKETSPRITAWTTNPSCARAAKKSGAEALYVPALNFKRGESQMAGKRSQDVEQAGYPKGCIVALPTINHDLVPSTREYTTGFDVWNYVNTDKPAFADSLSDVWRARLMGALVEVGPHVPITNKASLRFMAKLGCTRVWLSPELTLGQIADLSEDSPVELGIFISGAQELMITEHCLLMSQGSCTQDCATCVRRYKAHHLVDRKGFTFPVVTDALGRSHLYNGIELDTLNNLVDFIDIGLDSFMVDTTLLDKEEAGKAVRRAVRALDVAQNEHRAIEKQRGTTTGHLFRGVQ